MLGLKFPLPSASRFVHMSLRSSLLLLLCFGMSKFATAQTEAVTITGVKYDYDEIFDDDRYSFIRGTNIFIIYTTNGASTDYADYHVELSDQNYDFGSGSTELITQSTGIVAGMGQYIIVKIPASSTPGDYLIKLVSPDNDIADESDIWENGIGITNPYLEAINWGSFIPKVTSSIIIHPSYNPALLSTDSITYQVVLSDPNTYFDSAHPGTVIGQKKLKMSGNIPFTVPMTTTTAGYYIMVRASSHPSFDYALQYANIYQPEAEIQLHNSQLCTAPYTIGFSNFTNGGWPSTGNVFKVQLSDRFGSFDTSVARTYTPQAGTYPDYVILTKNSSQPVGAGYRLRITESSWPDKHWDSEPFAIGRYADISEQLVSICRTFSTTIVPNCSFNSGNIYTLQLSDTAGHFGSPRVLGTASGTGEVTLNLTLDSTLAFSKHYKVRVTTSSPYSVGPESDFLAVNSTIPTPAAYFSVAHPVIKDSIIVIDSVPTGSGYSYSWQFFGAGNMAVQTSNLYRPSTISYGDTGNYSCQLSVTNSAGCRNSYQRLVHVVKPSLMLSLPDTQFCAASANSISFVASQTFSAGNVFRLELSDSSGSFAQRIIIDSAASLGSGAFDMHYPVVPGSKHYRVRVVATNPRFTGDSSRPFAILNSPKAYFSILDTLPTQGIITIDSISTGVGQTYTWLFPGSNLDSSSVVRPVGVHYSTDGNHTIILKVKDSVGCTGSVQKTVVTKPLQLCYFDQYLAKAQNSNPSLSDRLNQFEKKIREFIRDSLPDSSATGKLKPSTLSSSQSLVNGKYNIPVVVHIVAPNATDPSFITYNQVRSQINALNEYYAPLNINFCLAYTPFGSAWTRTSEPGVMRYDDRENTNAYIEDYYFKTFAQTNAYPYGRCLNIYVVSTIGITRDVSSGLIMGIAPVPIDPTSNLDGVFIRADAFGSNLSQHNGGTTANYTLHPQYFKGKVCAHEVGHYLFLYHPFQGGCSGDGVAGDVADGCDSKGDRICDTPPVASASRVCSSSNANGCHTPYDVATDNLMDYALADCANAFTHSATTPQNGGFTQANRVIATLSTLRSSLTSVRSLNAAGLGPSGSSCIANLPPTINIAFANATRTDEDITHNRLLCTLTSGNPTEVSFAATSISGGSYNWEVRRDGTVISPTTSPIGRFSGKYPVGTPGMYDVSVTVTYSGGSISESEPSYFKVVNCSTSLTDAKNAFWPLKPGLALDFKSGVPVLASSNVAMPSTSSSSDASGNPILYTDGQYVWNAAGNKINDATGNPAVLRGPIATTTDTRPNALQPPSVGTILAVKKPNSSSNIYYLFYTSARLTSLPIVPDPLNDGLYYSVVDFSSSPAGVVTTLNQRLEGTGAAHFSGWGLALTPHCNGESLWLIANGAPLIGSTSITANTMFAYEISATGVSSTPVVSTIPTFTNTTNFLSTRQDKNPWGDEGKIAVSPDGRYVAISMMNSAQNHLSVFRFNKATGVMYDHRNLSQRFASNIYLTGRSFIFSPNSKYLYYGARSTKIENHLGLFQVDLDKTYECYYPSNSNLDIFDFERCVVDCGLKYTDKTEYYQGQDFQLGPDGNIYINLLATPSSLQDPKSVSVITNPNTKAIPSTNNIGLVDDVLTIDNILYYAANPFPTLATSTPISATGNTLPADFTICNIGCGRYAFTSQSCGSSFTWRFDNDPATDIATEHISNYQFTTPGVHTVVFTCSTGTAPNIRTGTITKQITVPAAPTPPVINGPSAIFCGQGSGSIYVVSAPVSGAQYDWTIYRTGYNTLTVSNQTTVNIAWPDAGGSLVCKMTLAGCSATTSRTITACTQEAGMSVVELGQDAPCGGRVFEASITATVSHTPQVRWYRRVPATSSPDFSSNHVTCTDCFAYDGYPGQYLNFNGSDYLISAWIDASHVDLASIPIVPPPTVDPYKISIGGSDNLAGSKASLQLSGTYWVQDYANNDPGNPVQAGDFTVDILPCALTFEGKESFKTTSYSASAELGTDAFTIDFFYQPHQMGGTPQEQVLFTNRNLSESSGITIGIDENRQIFAQIGNSTSNRVVSDFHTCLPSTSPLCNGLSEYPREYIVVNESPTIYYHVGVVRIKHSGSDDDLKLYVTAFKDGVVLQDPTPYSISTISGALSCSTGRSFAFGNYVNQTTAALNGAKLSDMRIWRVVRGESSLRTPYSLLSGGESDLVAYWRFLEHPSQPLPLTGQTTPYQANLAFSYRSNPTSPSRPPGAAYYTPWAYYPASFARTGEIEAPPANKPTLKFWPNPASQTLDMLLDGSEQEQEEFLLLDNLGRIVRRGVLKAGKGLSLDISDLPSSIYTLRVPGNPRLSAKVQVLR